MDVQDGYHLNTLLIRRQAFHRIGGFDPTIPLTNAVEWLWRARRLGLVSQMLPDVLAWRRIHGENMSIRERSRIHAEYFRLIRQRREEQRDAL
jgi:GT2 family glycosyltransferase